MNLAKQVTHELMDDWRDTLIEREIIPLFVIAYPPGQEPMAHDTPLFIACHPSLPVEFQQFIESAMTGVLCGSLTKL